MAGEKIKLFEADIDVDGIINKSVELKKEMVDLRQEQKILKLTVGETNDEYIKTEARLKKVRTEYNLNQKQVSNLSQSAKDFLTVEQKLTLALDNEVKSINNAAKNNKELKQIRNDINAETEEGADAIALINEKLNANTDFIKENSSALEQQKIEIGSYKDGIVEAYNELNLFNGGLSGFISRANDAGGAGNLVEKSVKGMTNGIIGLTRSTLAFIATPIGALLAVLLGAFALVKNAMNRSEEATGKINRIFSIFSGITNTLLAALEPLGEFLIDGIVIGFELAGQAADTAMNIISSGLSLLGFDDASKNVSEWYGEIQEGVKAAQDLTDAELKLETAQRKSQLIQLEYQKDAEKLRQIRDNENLSIKERIQANEELGVVLENQLTEELKIAELALEVANLRITAEGRTKEALDEQAEALIAIADIQERITGQESEQLTNRVSLQREAADKAKEIADQAIAQQRAELDLFIAHQGTRAKSLEEQLAVARHVYRSESEILEAELNNRNITQTEYDAQLIDLKNDLLKQQADATVLNAEYELDEYIANHQRKIDEDLFYSEETLLIEQERLNNIANARLEHEALRLEQGIINEQEYNAAINAVNEENRIALEEAQFERDEAIKEKEIVDLENKRAADFENHDYDLAFQLQALEDKRLQEVANAERTGADTTLINQKYAEQKRQIEQITTDNKLTLASDAFGQIATIIGKESAVGKAAAVAQTTIDTYKSAQAAYSALAGITIVGPILGAIAAAAAVAAGVANIKKITSTKTPKAERGAVFNIGGRRHSQGGTKFQGEDGTSFEAEKGEKMFILNRQASANLAPLLSDINQMYGGVSLYKSSTYLAAGGTVLRSSSNGSGVDYNKMAEAMAEGTKAGALEGSRQGSLEGSSKGTYSGIADREDYEIVASGANF